VTALPLSVAPAVQANLDAGGPVVALESTVIAHGLPAPANVETALACEAEVRDRGAVPATIAIIDGRIVVGCSEEEIRRLVVGTVAKVSRRDVAAVIARAGDGATTVAGTVLCAAAAGIRVMATGGIGGVHRGGADSLDVSSDLEELGRSPVAVVCAGAKSILDLPRTLEVLETKGVPVVGYGTDRFPAFFCRDSGLALEARTDTPGEAATLIATHLALPGAGGLVIANPLPDREALEAAEVDGWIAQALEEASAQDIVGKDVTPFLLRRVAELSDGKTLAANLKLLKRNAALAADIACSLAST